MEALDAECADSRLLERIGGISTGLHGTTFHKIIIFLKLPVLILKKR